jgi:hypothetical protein
MEAQRSTRRSHPAARLSGMLSPVKTNTRHIITDESSQDSNSTECAICYEIILASDAVELLPCHHTSFCEDCILSWLRYKQHCPLCRTEILSSGDGRLEIDVTGMVPNDGNTESLISVY